MKIPSFLYKQAKEAKSDKALIYVALWLQYLLKKEKPNDE